MPEAQIITISTHRPAIIGRPTLNDALAEAQRRGYGPMGESLFLDGARMALHGAEPLVGEATPTTEVGYRWAKAGIRQSDEGPGIFAALLIAVPFGIAFYVLLCAIILAFGPAILAGMV